jgi:hypothetical protein
MLLLLRLLALPLPVSDLFSALSNIFSIFFKPPLIAKEFYL